jgi:2-polyprenyl-6-methoxyphenol hydroxylase-like FAD-dependent oxidoreductase
MHILISGAGVAGPALACRLSDYGARVTVVEIAPALRHSGFAVDFRGPTHMAVLQRLGVLEELRQRQTHGSAMVCVDEHGNTIFELPAEFTGGELEVHRRDLSEALYRRSLGKTEYLFGDSVTGLTEVPGGVEVQFRQSASRTFDLVIGADGIHSRVRRIAFGPEQNFVRHLGYHLAGWDLRNTFGTEPVSRHFAVPGRMASVGADQRDPDKATALVVFRSPALDIDWHDMDEQKKLIAHTYAGLPWHVPQLIDGLTGASELYFDAIARVRMEHWIKGRVALLGDAAWGVTLGGMGVGTGIVGAHVLAGELALAGGNHEIAYAAYEQRMRKYAGRWQRGAHPGQFLAPATGPGLWIRNKLFGTKIFKRFLLGSTKSFATDQDLPAYP